MQESFSSSQQVMPVPTRKWTERLLWLCPTPWLRIISRLSLSRLNIFRSQRAHLSSPLSPASSKAPETWPTGSLSSSTSTTDNASSQTFPRFWVVKGLDPKGLVAWSEAECLQLRELFHQRTYQALQVALLRSQAQLVQALLDPSSLEREDLYELRGKAFMIRVMQEMPRLVEEALASFDEERKQRKEEENG